MSHLWQWRPSNLQEKEMLREVKHVKASWMADVFLHVVISWDLKYSSVALDVFGHHMAAYFPSFNIATYCNPVPRQQQIPNMNWTHGLIGSSDFGWSSIVNIQMRQNQIFRVLYEFEAGDSSNSSAACRPFRFPAEFQPHLPGVNGMWRFFFLTVNAWHLEPSWWMFHDVSWLDIVKCSGLVTTCQDNLKICFDPSDGTWGWRALMQHVSSFFFRNGTSLAPPLLWMPWNVHQHTLHLNGARTCCTSWISAAGFTMLRDVFSWVSNRDRHR